MATAEIDPGEMCCGKELWIQAHAEILDFFGELMEKNGNENPF